MDRSSAARQLALGVVVFVATLTVLAGLTAVLGRGAVTGSAGPSATAGTTVGPPATAIATPEPSASASAAVPSATAAPPSSNDPVLVGAGDIADCGSEGDEATAALLDDIAGTVFTAGDNAYQDGSPEDFADCYAPSWGRHLARTWPAPGNHDWHTAGLAGYRAYFGEAALGPDGASWYARDLGSWRVIVLDSACEEVGGCGPDSVEGRWLADELATHDPACSVAIFHHPRFSSGAVHGDQDDVAPFWDALYAAGVDVVVNGHDHTYERFAPQDPSGREDRAAGIRQFVVGTGGRDLYDFAEPRPNSEIRAAIAFGVLAFTLHPTSYEWRFVTADSDFSDSGTTRCH